MVEMVLRNNQVSFHVNPHQSKHFICQNNFLTIKQFFNSSVNKIHKPFHLMRCIVLFVQPPHFLFVTIRITNFTHAPFRFSQSIPHVLFSNPWTFQATILFIHQMKVIVKEFVQNLIATFYLCRCQLIMQIFQYFSSIVFLIFRKSRNLAQVKLQSMLLPLPFSQVHLVCFSNIDNKSKPIFELKAMEISFPLFYQLWRIFIQQHFLCVVFYIPQEFLFVAFRKPFQFCPNIIDRTCCFFPF